MDIPRVVLVVPTYNERSNIGPLIERILERMRPEAADVHVLVVDDASPDGTASVVEEKRRSHPNVHLVTGQKNGLGAAYVRGMRYALEQLAPDVVFEMDADFSHKPEDVPRLLAALWSGADFVIGSRYVSGGRLPSDWGISRRLNSLFGNLVARYGAGLGSVHDCTAGFRAIRADLLRRIDLGTVQARGYAFQIDLLDRALACGARVVEVPVEFVDRKEGESKLGLSDIIEFFTLAGKIRLRRARTFLRFCVVGASGVVVNLGVFSALLHVGVNKYVASPVAIEASIISNFVLNNLWTFGARRTDTRLHTRGVRFNLVSLLGLTISYTSFVLLSLLLPETAPQLLQLVSILPGLVVNYLVNSRWTFRHVPAERPEEIEARKDHRPD